MDAIINDVISTAQEGRSPILLTERKDHLEYLAGRLGGFVRHIIVLQGGMTTKARSRAVGQLESIPDTEPPIRLLPRAGSTISILVRLRSC
jgi:hypothetical protein